MVDRFSSLSRTRATMLLQGSQKMPPSVSQGVLGNLKIYIELRNGDEDIRKIRKKKITWQENSSEILYKRRELLHSITAWKQH